jgi:O-antigen/teichoic acid export membrane protein
MRGRVARDSLALATGSVFAGLLAYVFFALATRSLGAAAAAPVSILWSYWALAAAVLTFSVQHWIIATLARDGHESTVARSMPRIALAGGALAVLTGVVAFAARGILFDDGGVAFPAMVAVLTAGSLFTGIVRGALAGRRRYVASAACLVSENAVRVAGAVAAALAGAGAAAFGVALVVGSLTGLIWVRALRFEHSHPRSHPVRNPMALMSGIAGGSLIAQVVLTGGPVALAVVGGSPAEVTSVFVALAVCRAPYVVALGVAPQLTGWLARLAGQGQQTRLARLRAGTAVATLAAAGLAALLAIGVLPWLLRGIFGPDVELATGLLVMLGIGTAVALGNLVLLLLLLALQRPRSATWAWTAALVVAAGWLAAGFDEPATRVVVAFLLAQVTAFVVLLALSGRGRR